MASIDLTTNLYNGASEAIFVGDQNGNEIKVVSPEEFYRLYTSFSCSCDTGGFSFDVAISVNGNLLSVDAFSLNDAGNWWWYYYWDLSFQPGTYTVTMVIDPENKIAETNENNNTCTVTISVGGCTDYLMETCWNQSGYFLGDSKVELNAYCPIEPGATNHSVTGCSNTAAAQILYYFAQNGNLFTLQLNNNDTNTENPNITINASAANAKRYSYLEFSKINEKLYDFDVESAEDVAALIFASGVIADSCYSENLTATYTSGIKEVFERAGFHGLKMDGVGSDLIDRNSVLTDLGWAMIKENIAAGKPVYTSIPNPAHAVVVDGYDAETNSIHINFGWGFFGNKAYNDEYGCYNGSGWYTRAECADLKINGLLYNITPDTVAPEITITVANPVNGSVKVSAGFADDIGVYETWYQINGTSGKWLKYTSSVSVTVNCTIYFKAVDKGKNSTVKSVTVDSLLDLIENHIVGTGETFTVNDTKQVKNTTVNAGGYMNILDNGVATDTTVNAGGELIVSGTAKGVIENGGWVEFRDGATVTFSANTFSALTITGKCSVHSGTVAENITIAENGELHLYSGGKAWNTEVRNGSLVIESGAVHYGTLQFTGNTGKIQCKAGGIINIDLTKRNTGDGYYASRVGGTPTYTVTVSADLAVGEYKLIERSGATSTFVIGDGSTDFGTITIDGENREALNKVCYNGINYIVVWNKNHFDLKIAEVAPPEKPVVTVSTSDFTNKAVTVTPEFTEGDSIKNEYSYNGQDWWSCSDGYVFEFSENGTIFFRSTNANGDVSEIAECVVSNIDTDLPASSGKLQVTSSGNSYSLDWTGVFSDSGSGIKNYIIQIIDGSDLKTILQEFSTTGTTYSSTLVDGKYYFNVKAVDHAGNLSSKVSGNSAITIETGAPGVPKDLSVECSKDKVTLQWGKSEEFDISRYEFQIASDAGFTNIVQTDGVYKKTSAVFNLPDGKYYVRIKAVDRNSNSSAWSETVTITVDTIAPTLEISGNITGWTNKNVILTATASDGTIEYFDGSKWVEGDTITATENGTYQFRVTDAAGNVTEKSVVVDNIDKAAPTLEISGNADKWTNEDVVLTAKASDGTIEYFDGSKWVKGDTITATKNGTYQFRVTDAADNVTEKSIVVDKIDKVAPTLEISGNTGNWTNDNVTLKAEITEDNLKSIEKQLGIGVGVWDANSESIRKTMREIVRKSSVEEAKKWYREKIILRNGALKNPKFTPEEAKEWYQKNIVALQKKMADKNK